MLFRAEKLIRAMSGDELRECAAWLAQTLEAEESGTGRERPVDPRLEYDRQSLKREYLYRPPGWYQAATPRELALAAEYVRKAEEQAALDAEADRLANEEDMRRMQKLWLSMSGGKTDNTLEADSQADLQAESGRQEEEREKRTAQLLRRSSPDDGEADSAREEQRQEGEREKRAMQQLLLSMDGGETSLAQEAEGVSRESVRAAARAGESANGSPDMNEISEFFRRDSRRYDGGFVRY